MGMSMVLVRGFRELVKPSLSTLLVMGSILRIESLLTLSVILICIVRKILSIIVMMMILPMLISAPHNPVSLILTKSAAPHTGQGRDKQILDILSIRTLLDMTGLQPLSLGLASQLAGDTLYYYVDNLFM